MRKKEKQIEIEEQKRQPIETIEQTFDQMESNQSFN